MVKIQKITNLIKRSFLAELWECLKSCAVLYVIVLVILHITKEQLNFIYEKNHDLPTFIDEDKFEFFQMNDFTNHYYAF